MKVSFFMFRLLLQKLPLGESLTKLGFHGASKCYCCSFPALETFDHVFSNGDFSSSVWNLVLNVGFCLLGFPYEYV